MSIQLAFVLGILLGMGLPLAATEIHRYIQRRSLLRKLDFDRRIDAEIARREAERWGIVTTPHITTTDLTTPPKADW